MPSVNSGLVLVWTTKTPGARGTATLPLLVIRVIGVRNVLQTRLEQVVAQVGDGHVDHVADRGVGKSVS